MSKLYGNMSAERGEVTRAGHRRMRSHIRTWKCGLLTECSTNIDGRILFRVYQTGGSYDPNNKQLIYEFIED